MNDDRDEPSAGTPGDGRSHPETYRVGYKQPPLPTRFQPGQSGNPKGRPKGRRNLKTDLNEEFSERITVREGDRKVRMTKQRAMVKSVVARAIKGDPRALSKAFELLLHAFGIDDEIERSNSLNEKDEAILAEFLARNEGRGK